MKINIRPAGIDLIRVQFDWNFEGKVKSVDLIFDLRANNWENFCVGDDSDYELFMNLAKEVLNFYFYEDN